MKNKRVFKLFILLLFCLSISGFSQTNRLPNSVDELSYSWVNQNYGIEFVLNNNFTYSFKYNGKVSVGQWGYQKGNLCFKDSGNGIVTCYRVVFFNQKAISLQSGNGAVITYYRQISKQQYPNQKSKFSKKLDKGKILARKNGYRFTENHFSAIVKFLEFIIGEKISNSEKQFLKQAELNGFNQNPQNEVSQIEKINNSMQGLYKISDPIKLGVSRSALFNQLYFAFKKIPKNSQPAFSQIMNKHVKILSYDKSSGLILTQRDVDGFINYLMFMQYLNGMNTIFSYDLRKAITNDLITKFQTFSLDKKKIISSGDLLWTIIEMNWKRMSLAQKQQFILKYRGQTGYSSVNDSFNRGVQMGKRTAQNIINNINKSKVYTSRSRKKSIIERQREFQAKQNMFKMMYNMNLQTHATTLNIIENIGGTGNYWEVK
jgi:hypothetical protein